MGDLKKFFYFIWNVIRVVFYCRSNLRILCNLLNILYLSRNFLVNFLELYLLHNLKILIMRRYNMKILSRAKFVSLDYVGYVKKCFVLRVLIRQYIIAILQEFTIL